MNSKTTKLLIQHEKDLEILNTRRFMWTWSSLLTIICTIVLTFAWEWLDSIKTASIWWFISSIMIIVAINWWYWTIRIIRIVINHQRIEYELIKSILHDIRSLKHDIKEFNEYSINKITLKKGKTDGE